MTKESTEVKELAKYFPSGFVTNQNEFVISAMGNVYFRFDNCETKNDIIRKILHWVSRDCCKALPYSAEIKNIEFRRNLRKQVNAYIGKYLAEEDWEVIYQFLGNEVDPKLTDAFIESGFDMAIFLPKEEA